jgi:hypothetical protein
MLLTARDPDGGGLRDDEIRDQVMMLTITAGDAVAVASALGAAPRRRRSRRAGRAARRRPPPIATIRAIWPAAPA